MVGAVHEWLLFPDIQIDPKNYLEVRTNHYLLLRVSWAHNQLMSLHGWKPESIQCGVII